MHGGHLAKKRTAASVQFRVYWPTWSSDLDAFLRECEPCARYHRGNAPRKTSLQTPLVGKPWIRVNVDITGPHSRSFKSNQYILTLGGDYSVVKPYSSYSRLCTNGKCVFKVRFTTVRLRKSLVTLVATMCMSFARKIESSFSCRVKINLLAIFFRHCIVFICGPSWSSLCIATRL